MTSTWKRSGALRMRLRFYTRNDSDVIDTLNIPRHFLAAPWLSLTTAGSLTELLHTSLLSKEILRYIFDMK